MRTIFLWGGLPAFLVLLAGFCYERLAEWRDARHPFARGRLVDLGRHRLNLVCTGSGGPAVIIEQGAGEPSRLWWPLQEKLTEFAQVCTYDRAGYFSSDAARPGRSVGDRAEELYKLLTAAQVGGPYLLVAHSYGGLIVREFCGRYPGQTAGLILVDTPDEEALCEPDVQRFMRA